MLRCYLCDVPLLCLTSTSHSLILLVLWSSVLICTAVLHHALTSASFSAWSIAPLGRLNSDEHSLLQRPSTRLSVAAGPWLRPPPGREGRRRDRRGARPPERVHRSRAHAHVSGAASGARQPGRQPATGHQQKVSPRSRHPYGGSLPRRCAASGQRCRAASSLRVGR